MTHSDFVKEILQPFLKMCIQIKIYQHVLLNNFLILSDFFIISSFTCSKQLLCRPFPQSIPPYQMFEVPENL